MAHTATAQTLTDGNDLELVSRTRRQRLSMLEASNNLTLELEDTNAGAYRPACWGGNRYRIEKLHRGHDGRELSTGNYLRAGDGHVLLLTETEAESIAAGLNDLRPRS